LIGGAILNAVNQSLSDGKPRVEHNEIEKDGKLYKIEIVSAAIRDWKKRTVGALGHVRDLSFIYEMFEAFRIVMNSESPMESMLVALKRLGHKWGRLYLVDADDPYLLVSKLCFGFKNPHHKQRFEEGLIKLVRRDVPDNDSWMAIESDSPLIFCFRQDMENLSRFTTRYGLEAITINNPEQQEELEKEQGEFWLDLPIIGKHERPLGKLTVGWDGNYRRDRLDLIKVLIERAGEFIEFQQMRDQKVEVNTTEKLMGVWAHHLATRLASLPIILAKYRAYERQTGELKAVNKDFQRILTETLTMMQRVKERLAPVVALRSELDLAEQIENTLKLALPEGAWQFQSDDRPFTIKADGDKLNIALLEMIQNSREIVGDDRKLCVNVALANGDDWAKLVYRDNGPGVPDEFKQKIFDEFFSRRPGGESSTGLGLSFVRRVAHAHGGKVEEKGQPGQGAEFVISIPKTA
jgi:signal transduction histidine kinase